MLRRATLSLLTALASAGAAQAATLTARVAPPKTRVGATFQIQLSGTFKGRHAFLLAFVQYSGSSCRSSATKELHRTARTGGAYYVHKLTGSPFSANRSFKAGRAGGRRVCAYLFGRKVKPGTRARPLARADAFYRVTR